MTISLSQGGDSAVQEAQCSSEVNLIAEVECAKKPKLVTLKESLVNIDLQTLV